MANWEMVLSRVPHVKLAERKRERSTRD